MRTFSPVQFATRLLELVAEEELALHAGLKKAAKLVEKSAKSEIGHYQPEVGPFQDWAELTESTQYDRERKGFTPDDPLLRTGELRDSISSDVKGLEAQIGSDSDIMVYQEFGTATIPPRPVLGPAAFKNKEKIRAIIGTAAVSGLIGDQKIHESLGYDFETE